MLSAFLSNMMANNYLKVFNLAFMKKFTIKFIK